MPVVSASVIRGGDRKNRRNVCRRGGRGPPRRTGLPSKPTACQHRCIAQLPSWVRPAHATLLLLAWDFVVELISEHTESWEIDPRHVSHSKIRSETEYIDSCPCSHGRKSYLSQFESAKPTWLLPNTKMADGSRLLTGSNEIQTLHTPGHCANRQPGRKVLSVSPHCTSFGPKNRLRNCPMKPQTGAARCMARRAHLGLRAGQARFLRRSDPNSVATEVWTSNWAAAACMALAETQTCL